MIDEEWLWNKIGFNRIALRYATDAECHEKVDQSLVMKSEIVTPSMPDAWTHTHLFGVSL